MPNSYDGAAPTARSAAMSGAGSGVLNGAESFCYNSANLSYNEGVHAQASIAFAEDGSSSARELYNPSGFGLVSVYAIKDTSAIIWQTLSHNTVSSNYDNGSWSKTEISIDALTVATGKRNNRGYSIGLNLSYLYTAQLVNL